MRTIACKENKCSFEVMAPTNFTLQKIKIDGGVINDNETERCDYAVTADEKDKKHSFFFIELKGRDLAKAISQLETTIITLPNLHKEFKNKHARAVCSKITPFINSSAQVQVMKFLSKYKFNLRWHSTHGCHTIKN